MKSKNKSKLIGSIDYTNLMNQQFNVDTLGVITHNVYPKHKPKIFSLTLTNNKKENRVLRELYSQDYSKPAKILEELL